MNKQSLRLLSLIVLTIIIILIILRVIVDKKLSIKLLESFQINSNLNIQFMEISEAQSIIRSYHRPYFKKMKPMELVARNVLNDEKEFSNNEIVTKTENFYCSHILEFSSLEKKYISELILKTMNRSSYKQLNKYFVDWKLIKVDSLFEDGLPHTIDKYIVIPDNFVTELINLMKKNKIEEAIKNYGSTLTHEQIHVLQRIYPRLFNQLYTKYWRYKLFPEQKLNLLIDHHVGNKQRLNPDGLNNNYMFKLKDNSYMIVYVKLNSYELENVTKYGLLVDDINLTKIGNSTLDNYTYYLNYFGNIGNNYHPNELVATLLSEYVMLPGLYKNRKVQLVLRQDSRIFKSNVV